MNDILTLQIFAADHGYAEVGSVSTPPLRKSLSHSELQVLAINPGTHLETIVYTRARI